MGKKKNGSSAQYLVHVLVQAPGHASLHLHLQLGDSSFQRRHHGPAQVFLSKKKKMLHRGRARPQARRGFRKKRSRFASQCRHEQQFQRRETREITMLSKFCKSCHVQCQGIGQVWFYMLKKACTLQTRGKQRNPETVVRKHFSRATCEEQPQLVGQRSDRGSGKHPRQNTTSSNQRSLYVLHLHPAQLSFFFSVFLPCAPTNRFFLFFCY